LGSLRYNRLTKSRRIIKFKNEYITVIYSVNIKMALNKFYIVFQVLQEELQQTVIIKKLFFIQQVGKKTVNYSTTTSELYIVLIHLLLYVK